MYLGMGEMVVTLMSPLPHGRAANKKNSVMTNPAAVGKPIPRLLGAYPTPLLGVKVYGALQTNHDSGPENPIFLIPVCGPLRVSPPVFHRVMAGFTTAM